ncbi:MAG: Lsr2 family protein [Actinophytocola sp.]|uniref:histone-like nucleoid-structuring protein Lsr2 n=1 Tax=Actinophytocola sp. TaxID=1872138 RepID=UPI003C78201B
MAQQVLVQLVDDLDGAASEDVSTVLFGLDGVEYEIDLSAPNADSLRKALAEHIDAARRIGGRRRVGTPSARKSASSGEAGAVREWAIKNGYELSGRGRIPNHVTAAYHEAKAAGPVKAPAKRRTAKKR